MDSTIIFFRLVHSSRLHQSEVKLILFTLPRMSLEEMKEMTMIHVFTCITLIKFESFDFEHDFFGNERLSVDLRALKQVPELSSSFSFQALQTIFIVAACQVNCQTRYMTTCLHSEKSA
ncbi:hypothetical protein KIN20_026164 [Parelaphostrongylus tenuis]|uniref:Uncharacterized protein n=1 Tax=Parelaphostrongylus tenuis TaxID=148309 RepID=A0AAD5QXV9_PARTN|nr:hypothetical protein KIN20_026164 [Parelaphostrongylus tenuis]